MKQILTTLAAAALMLTACQNNSSVSSTDLQQLLESELGKAQTFSDSVTAIDGTFMGAFFNYNLHAQFEEGLDMKEVEKGLRRVMDTDTANNSYLLGLQVGLSVMNTFREVAPDAELDKEKLLEKVIAALRLDSVDRQQLLVVRSQFEEIDAEVKQRADAKVQQEYYESREAKENRMFADAVEAKLKSDPEYTALPGGIYRRTIAVGDTAVSFKADSRVAVTCTVERLDGSAIDSCTDKMMFVQHPSNPMLAAVIRTMHPGEEARFFIPYTDCYGVKGSKEKKIGPCESLFITVKIGD